MTLLGASVIKTFADTLSERPGVYRMLDTEGNVLYVGKAKRLKRRVLSYTRPQSSARIARMISKTASMMALETRTENEALLLEQNLVREINPPFNVRLRDSKAFPGVLLTTSHAFPRIVRHRGKPSKGDKMFGPFADGKSVEHAIRQIQRLFLLRTCEDSVFSSRTRPCLLHQIHKCSAPCTGLANPDTYKEQVRQATAFLEGGRQDILRSMEQTMLQAAQEERFEDAARMRDRLKALSQIQEDQHIIAKDVQSADIIALAQDGGETCVQILFIRNGHMRGNSEFYPGGGETDPTLIMTAFVEQFYTRQDPPPLLLLSHGVEDTAWLEDALSELSKQKVSLVVPQRGDKHNLVLGALRNAASALARRQAGKQAWTQNLAQLGEKLGVANVNRVEVYDNSHIQGAFALGVAVVATNEGFLKSHYRKYNFDKASGVAGNDVGMMTAMLQRRFARMKEDPEATWPDLLLIDGGITQLRAALDALKALDLSLPCIGVAKGEDRDAGKELLHFPDGRVLALPMKDPTLYFIQRLRDEAHRFAITSHRAARARGQKAGALDDIPGLGPAKKRALVARFGSQKAAKAASLEELLTVRGISQDLAEKILET